MNSEVDSPAGLSSHRAAEAQMAVTLHRQQLARLIFQLEQFAAELSLERQINQVGLLALERKLNQMLMSYLQTAELISEVLQRSTSKDAWVVREVKEHLSTFFMETRGALRDSIVAESDLQKVASERRFLTLVQGLLHPTDSRQCQNISRLHDAYVRTRYVTDYLRSLLATLILEPDQKDAPRLPKNVALSRSR